MKKLILALCLAFLTQGLVAFEAAQLSLDTPNVLKKNEGSFGIRHRFFGKADDYDNFLGADDGGNQYFSLKYALLDNLVMGVDHTKDQSAYGFGVEYAKDFTIKNVTSVN